MKKYKDFMPKADTQFRTWTELWKIDFPRLVALTLPHVQLAEQQSHLQLSQKAIDIIDEVERAKMKLAALVSEKEMIKKEFTAAARTYINMAKATPQFKEEGILGIGITCTNQTLDLNDMRPAIKTAVFPHHVEVSFKKHHVLSVAIYCRLPQDKGKWTLVGKCSKSPFIDKTPLRIENKPEKREYMAIYTDVQELMGHQSDICMVTFG
ncbi:hypothetical protein GCM10011379_40810 [Filimonas zeae]|uniref:Uncharacterized protein n=2 Tax=Filimonas zeae TaxID=1737353 RepID=A0A917J2Z9_9BACT|nr:hypothetical protein GCM10011379_40810 [Filimonas zeae]